MSEWVAIGVDICPVCYTEHNETVLLDNRMQKSFPDKKVRTGRKLCPTHEAMSVEYVALVEVSNANPRTPNEAVPTGNYLHIRRSAAKQIFNVSLDNISFAYMEVGVLDLLSSKLDAPSSGTLS